ncbi:MAG: hypothetical protein HY360_21100 [Verrucomicrobia bacterium]|nr:hypothetical protein [Verrucomicrobiota bacterium]
MGFLLNGKLAGVHGVEGPGKWDEPFALDISSLVLCGEENLVVVRVLNRDRAGGIWQPVAVVEPSGRAQLGDLIEAIAQHNKHRVRRNPPQAPAPPADSANANETLLAIGKDNGRSDDLKNTSLPGRLAAGASATVQFSLAEPRNAAVRLKMAEASFDGARIEVRVNRRDLLPYLAFGSDTRYTNCKGNPGLHPPLGELEANHVLPAAWMAKQNTLVIRNAGPGEVELDCLAVTAVDGDSLPVFKNSLHVDFDLWTQGYPYKSPYEKWQQDWILGIVPGNGVSKPAWGLINGYKEKYEAPASPAHLWTGKEDLEQTKLGYGYKVGRLYGYHFIRPYQERWAIYIDADHNPNTQHHGFGKTKPGADLYEWDPQRYAALFADRITAWAEYLDEMTLGLEWHGHAGVSGYDLEGLKFAQWGFSPYRWAENFDEATETVKALLNQHAPAARMESQSNWGYPEDLHFKHARQRRRWMADSIDILSTHGWRPHSYEAWDYGADNWPVFDKVDLARRYPGGVFGGESKQISIDFGMDGTLQRAADFVPVAETAIDFNRYRLSRTEKDMTAENPPAHRWNNGQRFNFDAGFDGDELMYNSETCGFGGYYFEPSNPYWFLRSMFANCLLPAAASESRDLHVPQRLTLKDAQKIRVNTYGTWVRGANHTQRLKTRDPLYGDLFGYTGFQFCAAGDYIGYGGLTDRYHRRPAADAFGLVRRTMNAFATAAPIYPAALMDADSKELVIKALLEPFDFERIVTVRAANFDTRPHQMDIILPVGWSQPTRVLLFDPQASFWHDGRELELTPADGCLRLQDTIGPLATHLYAIRPPVGAALGFLGCPAVPDLAGPAEFASLSEPVTLAWQAVAGAAGFQVQLASEAHFRKAAILERQLVKGATRYAVTTRLTPKKRYFWRVQAEDEKGLRGGFSRPFSFVVEWPEYAQWRKQHHDQLSAWRQRGEQERQACRARSGFTSAWEAPRLVCPAIACRRHGTGTAA